MKNQPRYPIYIPSKGRYERCLTARVLDEDDIPFHLVVEPQEADEYRQRYGKDRVLVLPFRDQGSVIPARNWIKDHATEAGAKRHWQLDDNILKFYRFYKGERIPCHSGIALSVCEDFTDRYTNIAISGLEYKMFAFRQRNDGLPPFYLNTRVYSCSLVLNEIPHRWRGRYNEDADICLQVLADGWCTVLITAFLCDKQRTMLMKGGNTDALDYHGDGRLRMAQALARKWPGVVEVKRRFGRPQHVVKDLWRRFDTPLQLRDDIDLDALPETDERGMKLKQVKDEIKSDHLRQLRDEYNESHTSDE